MANSGMVRNIKEIRCRRRKNNNQRALGMLLYRAGLSYRKAKR